METASSSPISLLLIFAYFVYAIFYIIICVECSTAAKKNDLSGTFTLILSLFFTPIMGFLYVIANKK